MHTVLQPPKAHILPYQILKRGYSGLPQQGILPISAKKQQQRQTTDVWKKTLPTVLECKKVKRKSPLVFVWFRHPPSRVFVKFH